MEIKSYNGSVDDLTIDVLVLFITEDDRSADLARYADLLTGDTTRLEADFSAELGAALSVYPTVSTIGRVVLAGLGKSDRLDAERYRRAAAAAASVARSAKAGTVAFRLPDSLQSASAAEAMTEGFLLSHYRYTRYKTRKKADSGLDELLILSRDETKETLESGSRIGRIIAEATCFARDLANLAPGEKTAGALASMAAESASRFGYEARILDKAEIEAEHMGGLLAVNRGSVEPPTFTILEWKPDNAFNDRPIVLVGKGVVFDTGGLSLKPTKDSMDKMKYDMAGAAAVIGAMEAVARLQLPLAVTALIPATDNRPGLHAYMPGEVVVMHSGLTVEVLNTDAEGRMILADALSYARRYDPVLVVDLATLTGAQVVALGGLAAALFTSETDGAESRLAAFVSAGDESGDRVAPLPMYEEYGELLESDVADIKNIGGRSAGSITAAKFLEHFTDYPWVHLDIAGPSYTDKQVHYRPKGGTGYGVRLLVAYLRSYIDSHQTNE